MQLITKQKQLRAIDKNNHMKIVGAIIHPQYIVQSLGQLHFPSCNDIPWFRLWRVDSAIYLVILAYSHLQQHLVWSTYPMCSITKELERYLINLWGPGLTKCARGVSGLFQLSQEHLLPPRAPDLPLFTHPSMAWSL